MIFFSIKTLLVILSGLFFVATVVDFGDISNFDQYLRAQFAVASHVVATVSLMHTQIAFLRCTGICFSTALFFHDIQNLSNPIKAIKSRFIGAYVGAPSSATRVLYRFLLLVGLVTGRWIATLVLTIIDYGFDNTPTSYFIFQTTNRFVLLYSSIALWLGTMINIVSETFFAYSCCFIVQQSEITSEDVDRAIQRTQHNKWTDDDFIDELIKLRTGYELVIKKVRQVQNALHWQILVSVLGNVLEIMVVSAWFVMFGFVPSLGSARRLVRYCLTAAILGVQLWTVGKLPLRIYAMQTQISEKLESLVYWRQEVRKAAPSIDEYDIMTSLVERGHAKRLTLSAGGVVDLTPTSSLTLACCILGFVIFAVDRMENIQSAARVVTKLIVENNITLPEGVNLTDLT